MTPIRDYALIGNCETAALIGPQGDIDWLCLPAFDAGSFFGALLDEKKGGSFALRPVAPFQAERTYVDDSAILRTRFISERGVVRVTDFFVIARKRKARFYDFTSLAETCRIVRLIEVEFGSGVEMLMRIQARPDYGRQAANWRPNGSGAYATEKATIFTNAPLGPEGDDLVGRFMVKRGERLFAVLDYNDGERRPPDQATIDRWLRVTTAFWHEWNLFNYYRGPHCRLVRRSAVTLKLLTYAETGGFVAAPTTSLPEQLGGDANWDYRFCWVRDTALFIQTLFNLGYSGEAKDFIDFAVEKWMEKKEKTPPSEPTVEVMFPVCDAPIPPETKLDHLSGYGGSCPVRHGNRAQEQFQLDNYGHLLQSLFYFRHTGGKIDRPKREMLEKLASETMKFWQKAENGIWEVPEKEQFTYGKVMSWIALQRARELAAGAVDSGQLEKASDAIRREIMENAVIDHAGEKILSARLDEPSFDASSLLAFTSGFLPEHLARSTRGALEEKLADGALLFRREETKNKEGAFLLCSFWWIDHLIREGHLKRAEDLLEGVIEKVSPLGLLSEEIDPKTGEFLGNFPQAFSHLGLIQSILNLEGAKKRPGFYALPDHEKFQRSVGATIGWKGVIAGFFRVPRTGVLFFSRASKWRD